MKVTDLINSYKDLLPEPSISHAEIIRLSQPDYAPVVLAFNLGDALAGKDQDLVLNLLIRFASSEDSTSKIRR